MKRKRHHSTKKNAADQDTKMIIHYRYLIVFIYPIIVTIKLFLSTKGHSTQDADNMMHAWFKGITITVILWTYPHINNGEF